MTGAFEASVIIVVCIRNRKPQAELLHVFRTANRADNKTNPSEYISHKKGINKQQATTMIERKVWEIYGKNQLIQGKGKYRV